MTTTNSRSDTTLKDYFLLCYQIWKFRISNLKLIRKTTSEFEFDSRAKHKTQTKKLLWTIQSLFDLYALPIWESEHSSLSWDFSFVSLPFF